MAPLLDDGRLNGSTNGGQSAAYKPRFLIIGAGSRGHAYAAAVLRSGLATVAAIAEPVAFKRQEFASTYIRPASKSSYQPEQEFNDWQSFLSYEQTRRKGASAGNPRTASGVDGVFVCVKDELHHAVVTGLAPLGLHIMCEKPLATTLSDCLSIQRTLASHPQRIFAIGHVLRYSPHNMLLRHLLLEKTVIGDVLSMEHTEPVGWWHYSHSYVRGNWRKESTTAPSLLTKSCHDIDFIMWMLCSPVENHKNDHLPSRISSTGSLNQFKRQRKPKEAGETTNCMICPLVEDCMYSAKRIYYDRHLAKGIATWPVDIVYPELPSILSRQGPEAAQQALFKTLSEDYDAKTTPVSDIEGRNWYGRCVWESDNDVCDDQVVTITWPDDPVSGTGGKTAVFHMIAQTLAQCERRGRIYGTVGEITYDSKSITVHDFQTGETEVHHPEVPVNSHHGGGDEGLTQCFVKAVVAVEGEKMAVEQAQRRFLGVTVEEAVRSHGVVFAAEKARTEGSVIDWEEWWGAQVSKGRF